MRPRERFALGALAFILGVTAAWWMLALWPLPDDAPRWLVRTRAVCFGAAPDTLPSAAGWTLLIGEPVAMLLALVVVWRDAVGGGLRELARSPAGRLVFGGAALALAVGLGAATARVASASGRNAPAEAAGRPPTAYLRLDLAAPPLALVDQHGDTVGLARYLGRPVLVTFAFAHCTTVCPLLVRDVLAVQDRVSERPAVLIVTLDPWRDTPARLASLAERWHLGPDAHVLSGEVAKVQRTLGAWNVARVRDPATGDVIHPSLVYLIDRRGTIAYASGEPTDALAQLVRRL